MGFVKSIAAQAPTPQFSVGGNFGAMPNMTGDGQVDEFVLKWGLDSKAQETLLGLDATTRARVMSSFSPTDVAKASRMFMGFVRSVAAASGGGFSPAPQGRFDVAPTAQQAFGANHANLGGYGTTPNMTGNHSVDTFVAKWGLDSKAQETLMSLDAGTQDRVMREFAPPDVPRASKMFMGFVKSVVSSTGGGGVSEGFVTMASATGDPTIDQFVAQWGLDHKALEALLSLDQANMMRVMTDFQPPDPQNASRVFMGFVKSVMNTQNSRLRVGPY